MNRVPLMVIAPLPQRCSVEVRIGDHEYIEYLWLIPASIQQSTKKEETMPKVMLMNSAIMPKPGGYLMTPLTKEQFVEHVLRAHGLGVLESYIGYPDTAEYIARITGVPIYASRAAAEPNTGDTMLVCRLKYRVTDPNQKGKFTPKDEDFEYFLVRYSDFGIQAQAGPMAQKRSLMP